MDSRSLRMNYKKKRSIEGVPRIPRTFMFDQNLPKEEYMKYITPENIVPESVEIATNIFSHYRKHTGTSKVNRYRIEDFSPTQTNKTHQVPDFEKSSFKIESPINQLFEESIIKNFDEGYSINKGKASEKPRLDDNSQDMGNEYKGLLREMARFSSTRDLKNREIAERPRSSPMKGTNLSRNGEDTQNQSKFFGINVSGMANGKEQDDGQDLVISKTVSLDVGKNNVKKVMKKSMEKSPSKKKVENEDYGISALDNTFEIVRKANLAVKTLSKRNEQVKREVKNFQEMYKEKQKENESAPTNSIKTVNLTKDFVFNEKEFEKIIEHEEILEEREKRQKEYIQRLKLTEKKRVVSPKPQIESKVKSLYTTATSKFGHFLLPRATSPKTDNVFITREEKREINKSVQEQISHKEEELKKQLDMQVQIHQKYGIFSSESNLFRIQSHNYVKLVKEKEKAEAKMIRDIKTAKYKKREPLKPHQIKSSSQSLRLKSVQSDRNLAYGLYGLEPSKAYENSLDVVSKEEIKSPFLSRVQEVLTKPIKDTDANKLPDYNAQLKRLDQLKKKYKTTEVEHVNRNNYFSL